MSSATKGMIREVQPATGPVIPAPVEAPFSNVQAIPIYAEPMPNIIVPPGGFYGFAQQTPATQQLFARAGRKGGKRSAAKRRRRKTAKKKAVRASGKRRRRTSSRKLVKGSAAAKRRMAQLRRMRRRK
jgi:hypothetical protein